MADSSGNDSPMMVRIRWVDSAMPVPEWQWLDACEAPHVLELTSVGYLIEGDADKYRLAQS